PPIPSGGYRLENGKSETFKCFWAWANYTGQPVNVVVFVKDGSGAVFTATLPLVDVKIERVGFDPNLGEYFNISVGNSEKSVTSVDLNNIKIVVGGSVHNVKSEPSLPVKLDPGSLLNLTCKWNWAAHQGENITIILTTSQGYIVERVSTIPTYAVFNVSQIAFDPDNTSSFNITIMNSRESLIALNVTEIIIRLKNGSILKCSKIIPDLPYILEAGLTVKFTCEWNWAPYAGEEITIAISTSQGYSLSFRQVIPRLPAREE
ncbi:MAG: hypothetical protein N3E47_05920, partial [Candidatus Bathyarchaeota archaeon]|nr:hypothetical protein [Candidatus Bathyarchaeota archaeon]